jgi:hypothetical protein
MTEVAVFEIEFNEEELKKFSALGKQLDLDFPATVRMCMNLKCDELLEDKPTEDTNFEQAFINSNS